MTLSCTDKADKVGVALKLVILSCTDKADKVGGRPKTSDTVVHR